MEAEKTLGNSYRARLKKNRIKDLGYIQRRRKK